MSFGSPYYFFLFLLVPVFLWFYRRDKVSLSYSSLKVLKKQKKAFSTYFIHLPFVLLILSFVFLVLALARPQVGRTKTERKTEGLDMMLAIDTSESMRALDLKIKGKRVDRLTVIKDVVSRFIDKRMDDRIGMLVFGTHAYAQAPVTLDHDILKEYLEGSEIGMAGQATAIGDALGLAINALKEVKSKNKLIILLTDGENTAGSLDPLQMTSLAKDLRMKIYTIGVGSTGRVPIKTRFGIQHVEMHLDEPLLKRIASETGARYFRAQDTESLVKIYGTIDQLEKTELKVTSYHNYEERYVLFLWVSFISLLLYTLLSATRFRRVP